MERYETQNEVENDALNIENEFKLFLLLRKSIITIKA